MKHVLIHRPASDELEKKGVKQWPVWTKGVSRFDWTYEEDETCYIIEGELIVETAEGIFNISAGDFVTFRKGLKCTWDIKSPVKKYYNFP